MKNLDHQLIIAEFDRQAEILSRDECRCLFQIENTKMKEILNQLRNQVSDYSGNIGNALIPCCIMLKTNPFPTTELMHQIHAKGANGIVDMTPMEPKMFKPINRVKLPNKEAYLLLNIDTGKGSLNISPEKSLFSILDSGRTPLTLEEGVMLNFFYPELLTNKEKFNCIQMPGSRIENDQRVPSIWFSKGAPRLGWCWDRNPHTWLASASAEIRI